MKICAHCAAPIAPHAYAGQRLHISTQPLLVAGRREHQARHNQNPLLLPVQVRPGDRFGLIQFA